MNDGGAHQPAVHLCGLRQNILDVLTAVPLNREAFGQISFRILDGILTTNQIEHNHLRGRQHLEDLLFELIEQRGFWIVPEPPHVPPGRHLVPVCYGCRRVEASLEFADCRHLSCCPNCLQQLLALNNPVHPNQPEHREPVRWAPCPQCGQRTWECSIFSCEI